MAQKKRGNKKKSSEGVKGKSQLKIDPDLKEINRKVYYDEALGHTKAGNFTKALQGFNIALELCPTDKSALVARSRCYLRLGNANQALEDAESALALDKTYIKDNKNPFPTSPSLLKELFANMKITNENTKNNVVSHKNSTIQNGKKPSQPDVKKSEKHLLGELYEDKHYLEELLKNPELISLNQDFANNDVLSHAEEGIAFLKARQEFWRQQKPNTVKLKDKRHKNGRKPDKK